MKKPGASLKLKNVQVDNDTIDLAAAGVKDLNNFKGYHNQEENKNDDQNRQTDPVTGAHFRFPDMCSRIINILKHRLQEKKILQLTGIVETLDHTFYANIVPQSIDLKQKKISQEKYIQQNNNFNTLEPQQNR